MAGGTTVTLTAEGELAWFNSVANPLVAKAIVGGPMAEVFGSITAAGLILQSKAVEAAVGIGIAIAIGTAIVTGTVAVNGAGTITGVAEDR
jgi:hypothetical protein